MKISYLNKSKTDEVQLQDAYWMFFKGSNDTVNEWGADWQDRWMSFNCFNGFWNGAILGKYNNPLSTLDLHLYADKDVANGVKVDDAGVISLQYSGDSLVKIPDDFASMCLLGFGWAGVNALNGILYPYELGQNIKKEKIEKARAPRREEKGTVHNFWKSYKQGDSNYVRVKHMRHYIADRFERNADMDIDAMIQEQEYAIADFKDEMHVMQPIVDKAYERKLEGKEERTSTRQELWVLTTESDKPVNAMVKLVLGKFYRIWDDDRPRKGISPIEWTGKGPAVKKVQAVIKMGWRLALT